MSLVWCGVLCCVAVLSPLPSVSSSSVVALTDGTFEHLTQASTGSTTGDWFIEFYAPSQPPLPVTATTPCTSPSHSLRSPLCALLHVRADGAVIVSAWLRCQLSPLHSPALDRIRAGGHTTPSVQRCGVDIRWSCASEWVGVW